MDISSETAVEALASPSTSSAVASLIKIVSHVLSVTSMLLLLTGIISLVHALHTERLEERANAMRRIVTATMILMMSTFIVPMLTEATNNMVETLVAETPEETSVEEELGIEYEPEVEKEPVEVVEVEPVKEVPTKAPAQEYSEPTVKDSNFNVTNIIFAIIGLLGATGIIATGIITFKNKANKISQEKVSDAEKEKEDDSYVSFIHKWQNKAIEYNDKDCDGILNCINNALGNLEDYHKRGLIDNGAMNRVYAIYFQDFKDSYKTYCDYIDINTDAAREVISSTKEKLTTLQNLLDDVIRVEIEKDAIMKDMEIDASRTSLKAVAAQQGKGFHKWKLIQEKRMHWRRKVLIMPLNFAGGIHSGI